VESGLQILAGVVLLAAGGEAVVRGAVAVARRLGVSELLIGLTLVGFGTSTPELVTSVKAAFAGSPGIAIGNVVGSNISNCLLVFGLVAFIRPVVVPLKAVQRDGLIVIGASVMLVAFMARLGHFDRWVGAVLLVFLVAYILFAWLSERRDAPAAAMHAGEVQLHAARSPLWLSLLLAVAGLAALTFGADLLVGGAIALATIAGISETVIGLTIVAVGTSLPELVASLTAALRGRSDVAFGNIVGSNIYNIFGILGATALIAPFRIPDDLVLRDWIALVGAAALLVFHAWTGARVSRFEAATLLALYGVYAWFLIHPIG
jgi:cation:H+ antiporter